MNQPIARGEFDRDWRRGSPRVPVGLTVGGRVPATPIAAHILDLSETGCRVRTPDIDLVRRGATILLALEADVEVAGQIVWLSGDRFGVRFHEPIAPDTIASISHRGGADIEAARE